MSNTFDALWVTTSGSLKRFDQPLQRYLRQQTAIAQWQYVQTQDEPSSLEIAVQLLQDYLESCARPLHLAGHGTGGLVALLCARRSPELVKSLTLLSVGAHLSLDWIAHYYFHLHLLGCDRDRVLLHMVRDLFGEQKPVIAKALAQRLQQDLDHSPSPNSLLKTIDLPQRDVPVPMLVCSSQDDLVIDKREIQGWDPWLKNCDRLWQCPGGRHFFHYFYPQIVGDQILDFWGSTLAQVTIPGALVSNNNA